MEKIPLPALLCGMRQNVSISSAAFFNQIIHVCCVILEALYPESPAMFKENQTSIHGNSQQRSYLSLTYTELFMVGLSTENITFGVECLSCISLVYFYWADLPEKGWQDQDLYMLDMRTFILANLLCCVIFFWLCFFFLFVFFYFIFQGSSMGSLSDCQCI